MSTADARPAPIVSSGRLKITKPSARSFLSVLVYGNPGVGKTALTGTADDDDRSAPVLLLDFDDGTESISHRDEIEVINIVDFKRELPELERLLDDPKRKWKTLVIDSIGEMGYQVMQGITKADKPEIQDWLKYSNQIRSLMTYFRGLNMHLLCTAWEHADDKTGAIGPLIQGGIREVLPGFFSTVGRLTVETMPDPKDAKLRREVRRLQLQSGGLVTAKDRMDKLGTLQPALFNPTVSDLLDRLNEGRAEARKAMGKQDPNATTEQELG